jgi:hypothetical protein
MSPPPLASRGTKGRTVNVIFKYHFFCLERSNVKFIYQYEQNRITSHREAVDEQPQTTTTHRGAVGDYPETSTRRLTSADIGGGI